MQLRSPNLDLSWELGIEEGKKDLDLFMGNGNGNEDPWIADQSVDYMHWLSFWKSNGGKVRDKKRRQGKGKDITLVEV